MKSSLAPRVYVFVAALVLAAAAAGQAAKTAPGDPPADIGSIPFNKFVNSQFYFNELAREVLAYEAGVGPCAGSDNVTRIRIGRPQIAMEFPKLGFPPQWMEIVAVTGCESPHNRAVLVLYVDRKLIYLPLVGGSGLSRFDVILQQDVIRTVISAERVHARRAGCKPADHIGIVSTRALTRQEQAEGVHWEEIWTVINCKGEKQLTIGFTSSSGGGTDFTIRQPGKN